MAFQVASAAQRARRRQQRPALTDGQRQIIAAMRMDAELRAGREARRRALPVMMLHAITCDDRWGAALEAARAMAPLEGQAV